MYIDARNWRNRKQLELVKQLGGEEEEGREEAPAPEAVREEPASEGEEPQQEDEHAPEHPEAYTLNPKP